MRSVLSCALMGLLTACTAAEAPAYERTRKPSTDRPVITDNTGSQPTATPGTGSDVPGPTPTPPPMDGDTKPVVIDQTGADNPAGLTPAEVTALIAGGPAGAMKWLYPYQDTVFPTGLYAPYVMWEGEIPDAVYLRLRSNTFDYKTVVKPGLETGVKTASWGLSPEQAKSFGFDLKPQVQFPQEIWELAGKQTKGKADPFKLELTARVDGKISGPISVSFTIARGGVRGSIYYNAYGSTLPPPDTNGKILRIQPGKLAEVGIAKPAGDYGCEGCHSVSANGVKAVWQRTDNWSTGEGYSTSLDMAGPAMSRAPAGPRGAFGALYPDGSKYLSTALQADIAVIRWVQKPDVPNDSLLYDTATGQLVPDTGIPTTALMPMFAPNGRRLVFNDFQISNAHGLAVMDYDTTAHKASNYQILMAEAEPSGFIRPSWPSFLPDNKAVVFTRSTSADFTAGALGGIGLVGTQQATGFDLGGVLPPSDVFIVDVATRKVTILARAMGYDTPADYDSKTTYLPFGASDLQGNYLPTVSPVASGGYYWVFFDSIRNFGNLGRHRQLWGTAIDISPDGTYTRDPSHPPFYLAGQELGADNHRAFAALNVCLPDGEPCTNGVECCVGFCSNTCKPPEKDTCSKRDERCASSADCCNNADSCINGFCALVELL